MSVFSSSACRKSWATLQSLGMEELYAVLSRSNNEHIYRISVLVSVEVLDS